MRIIAGFAKGILLKVGSSKEVRPTTDRIKESLFNIVGNLEDKRVIDLFAGSGALGLEALSRGAKEVYFFEKNKKSCFTIKENLQKVIKAQIKSNVLTAQVFPLDYKRVSKLVSGKFDYIFADPPYANDGKLAYELLRNVSLFNLLKYDGQLILEHPKSLIIDSVEQQGMKIIQQRSFGITTFSFIQKNR